MKKVLLFIGLTLIFGNISPAIAQNVLPGNQMPSTTLPTPPSLKPNLPPPSPSNQLTKPIINSLPTAPINPASVMVPSTLDKVDNGNKPVIEDNLIVIGTGAVTGVYYPAGGAICRLVNKERKRLGIRCAVESTPGSIYNIDSLRAAEIEFALIQSDWQEHSYNGTGIFSPKGRFDNLRFMFSLHNEALTVIVPKVAKINKFDDLKGHIVNIGPDGSGVRATMEDIMKAKGWSTSDFKSLSELKPSEQPKALCDGTIDAMIVASGHPNGLVEEVTNMCETKILDINDDIILKFVAGNPEFSATIIPAGLYKGIDKDVNTFGVKATFVTSTDISDEIAYGVTKTIFENLEAFKTLHPVFAKLEASKMVNEGHIAPYHNGALKYYKEQNLVTN